MAPLVRARWRALGRRWRLRSRRIGRERLGWTIRVRGAVIALFLGVAAAAWGLGVLPSLVPPLVAAGMGTVMNLLAARRVARWNHIPSLLLWTGFGDAVLITYLVTATGGTASPFLLLYVVQVLTTALVVDVTLGAAMGFGSIVLLAAAVFGRLPATPVRPESVVPPDRVIWLSSLGVTLLCLVFLGGHLTRRLARSERALASTHRRLSRSLRRLTETHASLREAYERLARAEAELVETDRLQTLQLLVAGLAHELGNPLTVLAGNMEPVGEAMAAYEHAIAACEQVLVTRAGATDGVLEPARVALTRAEEARRETPVLLANCAEATRRAIGLLGQLRDFGRGGRGTVRRLAPLAPGLIGTLALLRYRLPPGVRVHESYAEVPDVVCVPAELNQVFINLLMNAIDAVAPSGNLWLGLEHDGADVMVRVRDDGAGIDPAILPRMFEPFVTSKDAGRGTGLGLAISRAIVVRHHGKIEVETAAGRGTTFTVRLPIHDARVAAVAAAS